MPVLPVCHIADVDPLAAAYTPATHRCTGSLKTMYVGKRSHIRMEECWLEYRIDYLVNYLVEVSFLDAAETTQALWWYFILDDGQMLWRN